MTINTIQLSGLHRSFQRGSSTVQALNGIDLTITPGEFVALVGPSGSGKSTLLNLLGGLDRPSEGEMWLDGLSLHTAAEKERTRHRRQRVGFVFQSFNLLPRFTAVENVAVPLMLAGVPRAEREQRAAQLLERVGLGHRLHHYPAELSGGEQQRTAIARALIHDPALILADEPTGNLDSATGDEVMALLQALNREQGTTLVLVTHDPDVAAYADRIVHLRDGEVSAITTPTAGPNGHNRAALEAVAPAEGKPGNGRGLRFGDIIRTAGSNLSRRPVRNILTAMGVLIGIVTLVAMVSFGVGVQKEVQRNFETVGLENVFVFPQFEETDELDPFGAPELAVPLTPALIAEIEALPEVQSVTPEISLPSGLELSLTMGDNELPVHAFGGDFDGPPPIFTGEGDPLLAGEELAEGDTSGALLVEGLADLLLVEGESYADLVGREAILTARLPRGETNEFPIVIAGVQNGFGRRSVELGIEKRADIKAWWFGRPDLLETDGYDSLTVRAVDLASVPALLDQLDTLPVETQSLEAILDVANQVLSLLQALLGSVGALALLVAALGVANTMMMAIYERTREIGVLKALGAAPGEIRALFTVEAAMIGLIGGVFGLIFGTLLGRLVDWIAHRFLISEGVTGVGQLSIVPPWLAIGALVFAALIGLLAGLYPAARAARLDPVTALRHE